VTVKLLDAASGFTLWTERYDREIEDIFAIQDEIVGKIVAALPGRLEELQVMKVTLEQWDDLRLGLMRA